MNRLLTLLALTLGAAAADTAKDLGLTPNQLQPAQPRLLPLQIPEAVHASIPSDLAWFEKGVAGDGLTCQQGQEDALYFSQDSLPALKTAVLQLPDVHVSLSRPIFLNFDLPKADGHPFGTLAFIDGTTWALFACRTTPTPDTLVTHMFAMHDPTTGAPFGLQVDHLGRLTRCNTEADPQTPGRAVWVKQAYSGVIDTWEGSDTNDVFATGGYDGGPTGSALKLWRASTGDLLRSLDLPGYPFNVSLSRDGHRVAALLEDQSVQVYDVDSGAAVPVPGLTSEEHRLALSDTGRYAIVQQDGDPVVWDLMAKKALGTLPYTLTSEAFTSDDGALVWSDGEGLHSVLLAESREGPGVAGGQGLLTGREVGTVLLSVADEDGNAQVWRWDVQGGGAPVKVQTLAKLPVRTAPGVGADGTWIRVSRCDPSALAR